MSCFSRRISLDTEEIITYWSEKTTVKPRIENINKEVLKTHSEYSQWVVKKTQKTCFYLNPHVRILLVSDNLAITMCVYQVHVLGQKKIRKCECERHG